MNESQFPDTDNWRRKILSVGETPIGLHDHRNEGDAQGAVTITNDTILRADVANVCFKSHVRLPLTGKNITVKHVVAHLDTPNIDNFLNAAFPNRAEEEFVIIMNVSRQDSGLASAHYAGENCICFSMKDRRAYSKVDDWLEQFLRLDFDVAKVIAEVNDRGELPPDLQDYYAKFLDITHPGDPAAPLAFRLLCEAWKIKCIDEKDDCEGISITAPSSLTDWLKPFSVVGADDSAIATVVAKMGDNDTKTKVQNVLDTVYKGEDPSDHVKSLLGIEDNSTTQPEGANQ